MRTGDEVKGVLAGCEILPNSQKRDKASQNITALSASDQCTSAVKPVLPSNEASKQHSVTRKDQGQLKTVMLFEIPTCILIAEFLENGLPSVRGQAALQIMNAIHGSYKIANDDFLYEIQMSML